MATPMVSDADLLASHAANGSDNDDGTREGGMRPPNMRQLFCNLQARVNAYEERFMCVVIVEDLIDALLEHYKEVLSSSDAKLTDVTTKYYAVDDVGSIIPLPDSIEYDIESLWLGRITTTSLQIVGQAEPAQLKLHATKIRDDKPLPLLIVQNSAKPKTLRILRRASEMRHSHIIKYGPTLPGAFLADNLAEGWLRDGHFQRRNDDTSVWPDHTRLGELMTLWMGRDADKPLKNATLVADMPRLRAFVTAMNDADSPCLHFSCIGQDRIYAYLILTINDGVQTEVGRLPVGSATC